MVEGDRRVQPTPTITTGGSLPSGPMTDNDKLPRGHAYIHMRNRGGVIDIDYPEVDSPEADRIMKAVMAILQEETEKETEKAKRGTE